MNDDAKPIFWTPSNAFGKAASVFTEFHSKPLTINFYWGVEEISLAHQSDDEMAQTIQQFLSEHPITNTEHRETLHVMASRGMFYSIEKDPGWYQ